MSTALITGSVSGIGLEIAHRLAQRNYNLLLADKQQAALENQKAHFENKYGIKVYAIVIDLSELNATKIIREFVSANNIDVEVLVNNAGFFFFSEVPETDPKKASALIQLHIHTASMLSIYFSKQMKSKRRGYILFVSSVSAYKDFPGIAFYSASKAYIKSFARSLRTELKFYNINVTTVFPGATATNLYDPNVINVELGKRLGIMMSAASVAKKAVDGLFKNKATVIPGFITKLMLVLAILTPQWIIYLLRKKYKRLF